MISAGGMRFERMTFGSGGKRSIQRFRGFMPRIPSCSKLTALPSHRIGWRVECVALGAPAVAAEQPLRLEFGLSAALRSLLAHARLPLARMWHGARAATAAVIARLDAADAAALRSIVGPSRSAPCRRHRTALAHERRPG